MRSPRILLPLLTLLLAACSTPTVSSEPSASPLQSAAPSAPPSAAPSFVATPSPVPSPSAAVVGPAPSGSWSSVDWIHEGRLPLRTDNLSIYGWSGGFVALEQSEGSDANGNDIPVVIRASSSADGVHWSAPTTLTTGFKGNIDIGSVVEGPSGLLALAYPYGDTCGGPESVTALWSSRDGKRWERLRMPKDFTTGSAQTIAGGPAGFIALGAHADGTTQALWTSADGRAWTSRKLPTVSSGELALDGVASFDRGFVLVGSVLAAGECGGPAHIRFAAWYSADGSSWTRETLPGASTDKNASLAVRRIGSRVVITQRPPGDGPVKGWTSSDGKAWTRIADMANDEWWGSVSDGRHSLIVITPDVGFGPPTLDGVDDDGTLTTIAQHGDGPSADVDGRGWTVAVGPTGILVVSYDDGSSWLGLPS